MRTRYKQPGFWMAWLMTAALPCAVLAFVPDSVPRWGVMWLVSAAIFFCFKWLSWECADRPTATTARKVAWWLAWVGMDAARFLSGNRLANDQRPKIGEWLRSVVITGVGAALFALGLCLVRREFEYIGGWCGMFGMVLMLHFGLFHLLSCAWRAAGVDAKPIMNRPLLSASAGEFWGRRWNRAFRDASYGVLFIPVAKRWGAVAATWAVFVFSGIVHELAVSAPAKAGYGLPTIYFLLQGQMVVLENSSMGKRWGLGRGNLGRAVTLAAVFVPLPMLFHPPFVRNVIVPFMQWISAV